MMKALKVCLLAAVAVFVFSGVSEAAKFKTYKVNIDGNRAKLVMKITYVKGICEGYFVTYETKNGKLSEKKDKIEKGCTAKFHFDNNKKTYTPEVQFEAELDGTMHVFHGYLNRDWAILGGWFRIKGEDVIGPWYGENLIE